MKHMLSDVDLSLRHLADGLCSWERDTGRHSTVIRLPYANDEAVVLLVDGKPVCHDSPVDLLLALAAAYREKGEATVSEYIREAAQRCLLA